MVKNNQENVEKSVVEEKKEKVKAEAKPKKAKATAKKATATNKKEDVKKSSEIDLDSILNFKNKTKSTMSFNQNLSI
ncbi:hypothetical protein P5E85_15560, partial [Clostridium perfringens]|nr:hypothetical protein [Clostridium perfringens]